MSTAMANVETFSAVKEAREGLSKIKGARSPKRQSAVRRGTKSSELVGALFEQVVSPTIKRSKDTTETDLRSVSRIAEFIVEATDNGTLSEKEADAVLRSVVRSFAVRKLDSIFSNISDLDKTKWFLAASKVTTYE